MTHTPTPWRAIAVGLQLEDDFGLEADNKTGVVLIAHGLTDDDSAFIATACNAHDALVARVAELEQELEAMRFLAAEPHAIAKVKDAFGPLSLWTADGLKRHTDEAVRAALAKVPPC